MCENPNCKCENCTCTPCTCAGTDCGCQMKINELLGEEATAGERAEEPAPAAPAAAAW